MENVRLPFICVSVCIQVYSRKGTNGVIKKDKPGTLTKSIDTRKHKTGKYMDPRIIRGEARCPGRVSTSCSTCVTRHVFP